MQRPLKRHRDGSFSLHLGAEEREVLRALPSQLRSLLEDEPDEPSLVRLFPPAYTDDPEREADYRKYMGDDLRSGHVRALEVMERTIDAERLDEEQLLEWLRALNGLRLVLGTRLDVSEEMSSRPPDPGLPDAPALALFGYLGWLEDCVVEALES